jgi:dipeptidyl aminopeptidase/acylaminoacyl peptidase
LATPSPLPTLPTIITGLTATPTIEPESQAALAGETGPSSASPTTLPTRSGSTVVETPQKTTPIANQTSVSSPIVEPPSGWIAFAYYNPAPQRRTYEIHLLRPDGSDHHLFPLDSVSEPALHPTEGNQLAYRAWGDPGGPRSLLSSNLSAQAQHQIGGFWEDAQPDWSPQGDQLIYASQREQDRRWRLYTSRSDGTGEIDLPFEGRSPSFAPDGQRFVYEGCDPTGNRCGLWQASLDDLRAGATLLLEDAQAKSPDWSPDGESILYMAQANGNWDLYRLDLTTNEIGRLTSDPAIDGLPVWSPDGEWLAFLSNRDGNWGIWRYRLSDGATKLIFAFDGGSFIPPAAHYGERNWWDEQLSWGP